MAEDITVKAIFLFALSSKQDWINRVPRILPPKASRSEQWIWIDSNGNVMNNGLDFNNAELKSSYPCKVYKLQSVTESINTIN